MERKPDDHAVGAFFDELAGQPWLDNRRRYWPHYFFHVTDVRNAASILASGRLLCRTRAEREHCMYTDNASAEILEQSRPWLFDHVRLYFRPRTPTFWNNEGIRPAAYRQMGSHCPMPVALLFDAKAIAGQAGVRFSDGNLASRSARIGDNVAFLRSLDFRDIYHDSAMKPEDKARLTARRQAEIIVPGELRLDDLRWVLARSEPELSTLQTLHPAQGKSSAQGSFDYAVQSSYFHCRWTYLERIDLFGNQVRFLFNPDSATPGPFDAKLRWQEPETGVVVDTSASIRGAGTCNVLVPEALRARAVDLTVMLDDSLAFQGRLDPRPSVSLLAGS